jgi:hypothetical protein
MWCAVCFVLCAEVCWLGYDLWRNSNTKTSVAGVLATHSHFSDFSRPAHPTTAAAHDDDLVLTLASAPSHPHPHLHPRRTLP